MSETYGVQILSALLSSGSDKAGRICLTRLWGRFKPSRKKAPPGSEPGGAVCSGNQ